MDYRSKKSRKHAPAPLYLFVLLIFLGFALPTRAEEVSTDKQAAQKEEKAKKNTDPSLESLIPFYEPYTSNISFYKPTYFLFGTDLDKTKFQISFKYNIFNPQSEMVERFSWLTGVHFAYTQTSYWNLESDSVPFEDTSYMPELFWVSKNFVSGDSGLRGVFLKSGFQHESNGPKSERRGESSRSTNFLYIQPIFSFYRQGRRLYSKAGPQGLELRYQRKREQPRLIPVSGLF